MRTVSLGLVAALSAGCMDYNIKGEGGSTSPPSETQDTGIEAEGGTGTDGTEPPTDTGSLDLAEEESCSCPEGFTLGDDGETCTGVETFPATATGEVVEVCAIEPFRTYGAYGAQYPDGTRVKNDYWGQNDTDLLGRLNEVGVWGCDAPGSSQAGHDPIGEWIGFTVCVEVAAPGDYLVGLAGDNRVRMKVDDTLFYEQTGSDMDNFKTWHIESLSLDAGSHRIDLEGYNASSIAAFGAEVSGPFPEGSLQTDEDRIAADYAGNLVWSTSDAIGSAFPLGDAFSWTCPDGSTFQGCEEPLCEEVVEVPCE